MLKFAIIGSPNQNSMDLVDEIKKMGHEALVYNFFDITFETRKKDFVAACGGNDICDSDIVIFRAYNNHIYEAQLLAQMLLEKGKVVIEEGLAGEYVRGKLQQAKRLIQNNINHPETFLASNYEGWQEIFSKVTFPVIAKPVMGRKGRGIQKLNSLAEAESFFLNNKDEYLVQQFFSIENDFRIFVVGGKVIGGFQRFINPGEYKSNIRGTKAEKIEVSAGMEKIALEAARAMGYEIAGVDLFEHEGKTYIIEVNVCPQWEKFKLVTEINPAEKIIEYALEKYAKNSN